MLMFLENFLVIGQQVIVLFILIAVGFICGKKGVITEHASKVMTDIVLYAVTPCVMVSAFQREFSMETLGKVLTAAVTALVILAVSVLIARLVFRQKDIARRKVLQFSVIFSNCGFMSLPLQKELLGEDGWFFGSIFVAVFNIVVWTYGLFDMSGDKKQLSIKRLAFNPGIIGAIAAILLFVFGVQLPPVVAQPITHLANLNTPLLFRLLIIPLAAAFAMFFLKLDRTMVIAFTIACSAPTAATTTMFSAKFNRDTELSVSVVASTTLLSLVTMPLIVSLIWSLY